MLRLVGGMLLAAFGANAIALAVAVAAIATSARARAQWNAPAVVPVEISATQRGAYIQLSGPNGEIPCGERCVLQLPQGEYRVVVRDREGYLSAQKLSPLLPRRIIVSPANHGDKVLGIGLFAGGIAATAAGTITLYFAMLNNGFAGSRPCGTECVPFVGGVRGRYRPGRRPRGRRGRDLPLADERARSHQHPAAGRAALATGRLAPDRYCASTPAAGRQSAGLALAGRF